MIFVVLGVVVVVAALFLGGVLGGEREPVEEEAPVVVEEPGFEVPKGRFSAEGIWLAVQAKGWRRTTPEEKIELNNVRQSTAFYELGEVTLEVTLVEASSEVALHEVISKVRDPTQVVRFDYRAVKIHPVKGRGMDEAASQLTEHLQRYRLLVVQGGQE